MAIVAEIRDDVGAHTLKQDVILVSNIVARHHGVKIQHLTLLTKGSLPKTTSGKLRRGKIREILLRGEFKGTINAGFSNFNSKFSSSCESLFRSIFLNIIAPFLNALCIHDKANSVALSKIHKDIFCLTVSLSVSPIEPFALRT